MLGLVVERLFFIHYMMHITLVVEHVDDDTLRSFFLLKGSIPEMEIILIFFKACSKSFRAASFFMTTIGEKKYSTFTILF